MISDSEQYDDCSQGESDSDYNHDSEEEASVMDLSSDDELTTEKDEEKDEESEVAQAKTSDSINSLVAQEVLQIIKGTSFWGLFDSLKTHNQESPGDLML